MKRSHFLLGLTALSMQCPNGGIDCVGPKNVIAPPTELNSFNECGILCERKKRCNFWTMVPEGMGPLIEPLSKCFLLSNCNSPKQRVGVISGTKSCPPPHYYGKHLNIIQFTIYNLSVFFQHWVPFPFPLANVLLEVSTVWTRPIRLHPQLRLLTLINVVSQGLYSLW